MNPVNEGLFNTARDVCKAWQAEHAGRSYSLEGYDCEEIALKVDAAWDGVKTAGEGLVRYAIGLPMEAYRVWKDIGTIPFGIGSVLQFSLAAATVYGVYSFRREVHISYGLEKLLEKCVPGCSVQKLRTLEEAIKNNGMLLIEMSKFPSSESDNAVSWEYDGQTYWMDRAKYNEFARQYQFAPVE